MGKVVKFKPDLHDAVDKLIESLMTGDYTRMFAVMDGEDIQGKVIYFGDDLDKESIPLYLEDLAAYIKANEWDE